MLKNENAYIWKKNKILNLSLSKNAELFNFDKPLRIYKIKGEIPVKIYSDESKANLIYDGLLDFIPISVVFTDKIFIETENTGVDIQIISEYGILKTDLSPYLNTSAEMVELSSSYNDDGTFTVNLDFDFKFNSSLVDKIIISSNHYIGFSSNKEDLKIFRRDGCSTKIYNNYYDLENGLRFLKIRFEGYTYYNSRVEANRLIYELFLLSNNDMFLNIERAPDNIKTGVSELNYNGKKISLDMVNATHSFYIDDLFLDWTNEYGPYVDKNVTEEEYYIVEENNIYYSENNGVLEATNIIELKAVDFVEYASITKPLSNNLISLKNPKIYKWTSLENGRKIKATISAYPYPKYLEKTADMSSESIIGIKHLSAEYSGNVGVSYSVDNALTFSEDMPIQEFLNIDLDALYLSLMATKTLILRFILNNDAMISRFKILYKN